MYVRSSSWLWYALLFVLCKDRAVKSTNLQKGLINAPDLHMAISGEVRTARFAKQYHRVGFVVQFLSCLGVSHFACKLACKTCHQSDHLRRLLHAAVAADQANAVSLHRGDAVTAGLAILLRSKGLLENPH